MVARRRVARRERCLRERWLVERWLVERTAAHYRPRPHHGAGDQDACVRRVQRLPDHSEAPAADVAHTRARVALGPNRRIGAAQGLPGQRRVRDGGPTHECQREPDSRDPVPERARRHDPVGNRAYGWGNSHFYQALGTAGPRASTTCYQRLTRAPVVPPLTVPDAPPATHS